MNKTTKLFLVAIILIIIISGIVFIVLPKLNTTDPAKDQQNPSNTENDAIENSGNTIYKDYVNSNLGIKFMYPVNYELSEDFAGITIVYVLSEREDATDLFRENLNVNIQDLSAQPMTLDEYHNLSLEQIETFIANSEVISVNKTTLAGKPAYEVIYIGQASEGYDLKWKQSWTVVDDTAYVITYTAESSQFDNYLDIFNKAFSTFEISD